MSYRLRPPGDTMEAGVRKGPMLQCCLLAPRGSCFYQRRWKRKRSSSGEWRQGQSILSPTPDCCFLRAPSTL